LVVSDHVSAVKTLPSSTNMGTGSEPSSATSQPMKSPTQAP
jgi:hypothetical protein